MGECSGNPPRGRPTGRANGKAADTPRVTELRGASPATASWLQAGLPGIPGSRRTLRGTSGNRGNSNSPVRSSTLGWPMVGATRPRRSNPTVPFDSTNSPLILSQPSGPPASPVSKSPCRFVPRTPKRSAGWTDPRSSPADSSWAAKIRMRSINVNPSRFSQRIRPVGQTMPAIPHRPGHL